MDALLSGLVLAAVTGVTFIAYKHPTGYQRLFALISTLGGAVIFLLVGYVAGEVSYAIGYLTQMLKDAPETPIKSVDDVINSLDTAIARFNRGLLIAVIAWGYFVFLTYLPKILAEEEKKPADSGGQHGH